MGAEFNWWLLIVGIVGGGALTWLVLADSTRLERDLSDEETTAEAAWIANALATPQVDAQVAEDVLRAHRRYLGFPPPDVLVAPEELATLESDGAGTEPPSGPVDLFAAIADDVTAHTTSHTAPDPTGEGEPPAQAR